MVVEVEEKATHLRWLAFGSLSASRKKYSQNVLNPSISSPQIWKITDRRFLFEKIRNTIGQVFSIGCKNNSFKFNYLTDKSIRQKTTFFHLLFLLPFGYYLFGFFFWTVFVLFLLGNREEAEQTLQRTREVGSLTLAASLAAELGVRPLNGVTK